MIASRTATIARFCACLLAAVALGLVGGSSASELGAFEDEPAHVVTALMIRDWLVTLDPLHPVRFAEEFYLHYPKVAIGQWPPVYHGLLALWMVVFGASKAAVLGFGWLLVALTATFVGRLVVAEVGEVGEDEARDEMPVRGKKVHSLRRGMTRQAFLFGLAGGLVFAALPLVQALGSAAMLEVLVALFGTLAAVAFARWMEAPGAIRATAFALLAVLAILTKGSGLGLALVPVIAITLARRPRLVLEPSLWLIPLVVAVACGPWYALSLDQSRSTWAEGSAPGFEFVARALRYYSVELVAVGGGLVSTLALIGIWARLGSRSPAWPGAGQLGRAQNLLSGRERSAALLAWPLALGCLHCVVPSSLEARHFVAAAPVIVVFAALGAHAIVGWAVARGVLFCAGSGRRFVSAALLLVSLFLAQGFPFVHRHEHGFEPLAAALQERPDLDGRTVLVASGAAGEGLGVLTLALTDVPRRSRQVLRASKVLARASWIGADYESRFTDAASLRRWLESVPVAAIIFDNATPLRHRRAHVELLRGALLSAGSPWRLVRTFDRVSAGESHPGALELWVAPELALQPPVLLGLDEVMSRPGERSATLAREEAGRRP